MQIGDHYQHRQNEALSGTIAGIDKLGRIHLTLDGTGEEYRCSATQIALSWDLQPAPPAEPAPPQAAPPQAKGSRRGK